jgi:hypothetical protein
MSLDFIIHTHNLPARSQHTHWGHRFAWKHEGRNVRLGVPPEVSRSNVTCDLDGNVMRMTKTVLRPCFGSPTAYLVHGGDQFIGGKKGISARDVMPARLRKGVQQLDTLGCAVAKASPQHMTTSKSLADEKR